MKKTKGLYRIFYLIIYYEARDGRTEGILENEKKKKANAVRNISR